MKSLFRLQVLLDLVDKMSGPMGGALDRLTRFAHTAGNAGNATNRLESRFVTAGHAADVLAWHIKGIDSASRAFDSASTRAGGLLRRLQGMANIPNLVIGVGAVLGGKSIMDALGFKEQNLITFEVLLKNKAQAAASLQELQKFAAITPFETPEVISAGKQLLAFGFGVKDLIPYMTTAGNLASGMGKDLGEVVSAFGRLKSGQFGEAFERFRDFGISRELLEGQGLKFDKGGSFKGSVSQAMTAVNSIIESRFGGMIQRQSMSIQGLLSTLASRPFELFSSLDVGIEGPLKGVRKFLSNLADLTDFSKPPGSQIAARFQIGLTKIFDGLGLAADQISPQKAQAVVDKILGTFDRWAGWLQQHGPKLRADITEFFAGFKSVIDVIKSFGTKAEGAATKVFDAFQKLKGALGFKVDIAGAPRALGVITALAGGYQALEPAIQSVNMVLQGSRLAYLSVSAGAATLGANITALRLSVALAGGPLAYLRNGVLALASGFRVLALSILTNPITWIVVAVVGLVAAFIWAWQNVDEFRVNVSNALQPLAAAWNEFTASLGGLADAFGPIGTWFRNAFKDWPTVLGNVAYLVGYAFGFILTGIVIILSRIGQEILQGWSGWVEALTGFVNIVVGLFTGDMDKARLGVMQVFEGIGKIITAPLRLVGVDWSMVKDSLTKAWHWITDMGSKFYKAGVDMVQGLMNGMTGKVGAVTDATKNLGNEVILTHKTQMQTNSPSKVFDYFGSMLGLGLALGIGGTAPLVSTAITDLVTVPSVLQMPNITQFAPISSSFEPSAATRLAGFTADEPKTFEGTALTAPVRLPGRQQSTPSIVIQGGITITVQGAPNMTPEQLKNTMTDSISNAIAQALESAAQQAAVTRNAA